MTYKPKDNSGSLWKNDRREKDTHPNAKGSAVIDGVEYWVSAWTRETDDGQKYQSLSFKRKEEKPRTHGQMKPKPQASSTGFDDMDDDVPWN